MGADPDHDSFRFAKGLAARPAGFGGDAGAGAVMAVCQVHLPGLATLHLFLTPLMLKRSDWSTMACRHGQPTRLARYRTSKCARHTGAGLWFERCPGGGAVLLRWRGVLGLLCAARGRLGVGPVLLLRLHGRANGVVAPDTVTSCAPAVGSSAPLVDGGHIVVSLLHENLCRGGCSVRLDADATASPAPAIARSSGLLCSRGRQAGTIADGSQSRRFCALPAGGCGGVRHAAVVTPAISSSQPLSRLCA
jgi:hypothetical protein